MLFVGVMFEYEVKFVLKCIEVGVSVFGVGLWFGWDVFLCMCDVVEDCLDVCYELYVIY